MPALAVAGRGDLLFAAAELIERDGGEVRRRVVSAAELCAGQLAPPELLERLGRRRDPIAGLALDRPLIMGVVNVTPDSFSDGGRYLAPDAAIAHALRLEAEGADILDIGAEFDAARLRAGGPAGGAAAGHAGDRGAGAAGAGAPVDRHAQGRGDAARGASGRGSHQRCLGPDARPRRLAGRSRDGLAGGPDARPGRSPHHAGQPALRRRRPRRLRLARRPHRRLRACRHPALPADRRSRHRLRQDAGAQPGAARRLEHLPRARAARSCWAPRASASSASSREPMWRIACPAPSPPPSSAPAKACRSCASTMSPPPARPWRCGRAQGVSRRLPGSEPQLVSACCAFGKRARGRLDPGNKCRDDSGRGIAWRSTTGVIFAYSF